MICWTSWGSEECGGVGVDATSRRWREREIGAQAFTHGEHVFYGAGKGPANDHLTAHELDPYVVEWRQH